MEADTLIELKTTDADGKISFIADLPIDGTYYVKELYARMDLSPPEKSRNLFLSTRG